MGLFDLNKAEAEVSVLGAGIRKVFLTGVVAKEYNGAAILEFSFKGRENDRGFFNISIYENTFDRDSQYNSPLTDEKFETKVGRELGKIKTLVTCYLRVTELPNEDTFADLANAVEELFNKNEEYKTIETELKLVLSQTDKVIVPMFNYISTPLNKKTLKIDPTNKYDRIVPLEAVSESAYGSLAGDDDDVKTEESNDDLYD